MRQRRARRSRGHLGLSAGGGLDEAISDTTPDAFEFTDQTNVDLSSTITSSEETISGFDGAILVEISGGNSPEINVNGGGWESAGSATIESGQTLQVRDTSGSVIDTETQITVTVGNTSDVWSYTTHWWPADATMMADFINERYMVSGSEVAEAALFTNTLNITASGADCDGDPVIVFDDLSWHAAGAEGTFVVDGNFPAPTGSQYILVESSSNRLIYGVSNGTDIQGFDGPDDGNDSIGGTEYGFGSANKMAVAYDATGATLETALETNTNADVDITKPATLYIGSLNGGAAIEGHCRSITYYATRITGASLSALVA